MSHYRYTPTGFVIQSRWCGLDECWVKMFQVDQINAALSGRFGCGGWSWVIKSLRAQRPAAILHNTWESFDYSWCMMKACLQHTRWMWWWPNLQWIKTSWHSRHWALCKCTHVSHSYFILVKHMATHHLYRSFYGWEL